MSSDLVDIFLLSLVAMFNPTLLAAVTIMMLMPNPKRLMLGYLLGAYTTSITCGCVIVFVLGGSSSETSSAKHTISPAEDIIVGLLSLSLEKNLGLWSRVAGDGLDIATVATAMRPGNRKIGNVLLTLALLGAITAIDVLGAQAVTARHQRTGGTRTQYRDRSGFPQGLAKARGAARDFRPQQPPAAPRLASVSG